MWGKIIGGMAGFAMGGPFGAVVGAALGHAAETGTFGQVPQAFRLTGTVGRRPLPGQRDHAFAVAVVVIAAKLAKCDGPVVRAEIDAFKGGFRIPRQATQDIGRLFDRARDSDEDPIAHARQLGMLFADNRIMLEDVLAALFSIARADAPLNRREEIFLAGICQGFQLNDDVWERLKQNRPRRPARDDEDDPYAVLGVSYDMTDEQIRLAWRQLMRDNHPDSLASRGVPAEFIARAGDKVARINAAWDRVKRERGL